MMHAVTTFPGHKLRVDLECLTTPSGVVVGNLRAVGPMVAAERQAIGRAMIAAFRRGGRFVVLDATEVGQVDSYGLGEILLLNGRLRLVNRHFSLVVQEGRVAECLRKYGVLEIVKNRQPLASPELPGFPVFAATRPPLPYEAAGALR